MIQSQDVTKICPNAVMHRRGNTHFILMPENMKEEEQKIRDLCETSDVEYEIRYRTHCQVFSRIVGYMQPINLWNEGKKSEYKDRKLYKPDRKSFTPPTPESAQRTLIV